MTDEKFYAECAALLGTTYDCKPFPYYRRTRWNNRAPGSGRFPGHGLIRAFGSTVQIATTKPAITAVCDSKEEALLVLAAALQQLQT
jgi:hypothetical protein